MKPIPIGTKGSYAKTVGVADLASNLDPSLAAVLSTPTMVAMMEQAAIEAIKPFLDAGESSVGMTIEVSHSAATPPGLRARAEAVECRTGYSPEPADARSVGRPLERHWP